jgi:enoyl-CoA hydratase/carnithine racemase
MARLPRLIGRGRALEVLLGADDIGGDIAELNGYVNRSLPDAEFDAFVDELATRFSSFDKQAIAETKRLVNLKSLPPDAEIALEWAALIAFLGRPASQARIRTLFERGFHKPRCRNTAWISRRTARRPLKRCAPSGSVFHLQEVRHEYWT